MEKNNNNSSIVKAPGIDFVKSGMDPANIAPGDNLPANPLLRNMPDFITFEKNIVVPYTQAADANYYPVFYVATVQCFLLEAKLRHAVAGGAAAEVNIEKLATTIAKASGSSMLSSAFDLTAAANTVQRRTGTITLAGIQLIPGDAMALRPRGTLTNASEVSITVLLGMLLRDMPTSANIS